MAPLPLLTAIPTLFIFLFFLSPVSSLPIPAPDIPTQCNSVERCCMPTPYKGTPGIRLYTHSESSSLPLRTRRPAHLLTDSQLTKLEKAYTLMRALPDSDPRSLDNQRKLHCLYCDNALYYPNQSYPLEIHNGWFFLPWHRMFLYWHERILAKLLGDDTFALPFWAYDNQETKEPTASTMPLGYAKEGSSLWDVNRNECAAPPNVADLDTRGRGCTNLTSEFLRTRNNRLMYINAGIGAPLPSLLFGMPYRFGDWGAVSPGTLEDQPHGPVHAWVGNQNAQPPLNPFDDMGNFGKAAGDPIFYTHHSNMDRLWTLWNTKFMDGKRAFPMDSDFNNSQFTFYDENANLVKMNVSDVLDYNLLNYKYEDLATPWVTNGVAAGEEDSIPRCNAISESAIQALIRNTPKHNKTQVLTNAAPITFRVNRPKRQSVGTEILELSGLTIPNSSVQALFKAYLFFPEAQAENGPDCPEYFGAMNFFPHVGQALHNPRRVWRAALSPRLKQLGLDYLKSLVVTMVQTSKPPGQNITFTRVKIKYLLS